MHSTEVKNDVVTRPHDVDIGDVVKDIDPSEDEAARYANMLGQDGYDRKEEGKLRWKIDLRLVPILWFNITLGAVDKLSTGTAALYGMRTDTGLTGDKYSWVGSAFYFGYLVWCIPSSQILQRLPIAKTMFVAQFVWGIVLIGTGFAQNFATLMALRILLGALEAPIAPGNYIILSMWYPRREQALRNGLFYTGLSTIITGPIAYAIGFMSNPHVAWRSFFWITGGITIAWAVVVGIFLPDSPTRAKFITEREKAIAIERMRADQTGIENKKFKWEQVWDTLRDAKTWLMFFFHIWVSIPNGGLTNFLPLIINGLGFTKQQSALLSIPPGLILTLSSYVCNFGVFLCNKRWPHMKVHGAFAIGGLIISLISTVFLYILPLTSYWSRCVALWFGFFYLGPYLLSLGLVVGNTAGHTKKVTLNALVFMAYCISNIIGPQFFKARQAPLYPIGCAAMMAAYALAIFTMALYMIYCWRENNRRDALDHSAGERVHLDTDFKDMTDTQNIHFRYIW